MVTESHLNTFSNAAFRLRLDATEKSNLLFEPGGSRFASSVMYGTLDRSMPVGGIMMAIQRFTLHVMSCPHILLAAQG